MRIFVLESDQFNGLVSEAAYNNVRLEMSSGDYGSHKANEIDPKNVSDSAKVIHFVNNLYKTVLAKTLKPKVDGTKGQLLAMSAYEYRRGVIRAKGRKSNPWLFGGGQIVEFRANKPKGKKRA